MKEKIRAAILEIATRTSRERRRILNKKHVIDVISLVNERDCTIVEVAEEVNGIYTTVKEAFDVLSDYGAVKKVGTHYKLDKKIRKLLNITS